MFEDEDLISNNPEENDNDNFSSSADTENPVQNLENNDDVDTSESHDKTVTVQRVKFKYSFGCKVTINGRTWKN